MALKSAGTEPVGKAELEAAAGPGLLRLQCRHGSVSQLALEESSNGTGGPGGRRSPGEIMFLQHLGPLPADCEFFRHSATMVEKLDK